MPEALHPETRLTPRDHLTRGEQLAAEGNIDKAEALYANGLSELTNTPVSSPRDHLIEAALQYSLAELHRVKGEIIDTLNALKAAQDNAILAGGGNYYLRYAISRSAGLTVLSQATAGTEQHPLTLAVRHLYEARQNLQLAYGAEQQDTLPDPGLEEALAYVNDQLTSHISANHTTTPMPDLHALGPAASQLIY